MQEIDMILSTREVHFCDWRKYSKKTSFAGHAFYFAVRNRQSLLRYDA